MHDIKCHMNTFRLSPIQQRFVESIVADEKKTKTEIIWEALQYKYAYRLWEKHAAA